jgi:alkaline phosphatase isozyme conversion protein
MKRVLPLFLLLVLVLNGCSGGIGSSARPTPTSAVATLVPLGTPSAKYGTEVARPLIRDFVNIGPRVAGSPAEAQTAQYIASVFSMIGYTPETQSFTADSGNNSIKSANVVAVKKGTSSQEIIVGAHYDTGAAGPGADDNASGVAVMLEVAKLVMGSTTPYTIRFIAFGAEESGLLGSYAYINQMSQDEFENVIAMIDLNSLVAGDIAYVYSDEGKQSAVRDWALDWAAGNGFDLQTIPNVDLTTPDGKGSSDYAPFRDAGIPFAYFETTNWTLGDKKGSTQVDPHFGDNGVIRNTKFDTLDYLDATFPGRVDQHLNLYISVLFNLLTQYEDQPR